MDWTLDWYALDTMLRKQVDQEDNRATFANRRLILDLKHDGILDLVDDEEMGVGWQRR